MAQTQTMCHAQWGKKETSHDMDFSKMCKKLGTQLSAPFNKNNLRV